MNRCTGYFKEQENDVNRGFSLIEVLVAMLVFTIAALGLAALNKVSMSATVYGRDRTAAMNIAQHAMAWIQNEAAGFAPNETLGTTTYPLLDAANGNFGAWQVLGGVNNFRFDQHLGNNNQSIYNAEDTARFCVDYMVSRLPSSPTAANPTGTPVVDNLFNVSVRVTWPRENRYTANWKNCQDRIDNHLTPSQPAGDPFHQMVITKVLTRDFSNKL